MMRSLWLSILSILSALQISLAAPQATNTRVSSERTRASESDESSTPSLVAAPTRSWPTTLQHGSFSGTPTTTGALTASEVGTGIVVGPPATTATTYKPNGELQDPQPAPYVPDGGRGTNTTPTYQVKSDFDYQSLALALYQEWIELDLFRAGLEDFSIEDFEEAGLSKEDRALIEFMAWQEIGHATTVSNMLGPSAPQPCFYQYNYKTVREFVDFCQKLTRWGEAGVYGFLGHLDSGESASILLQSITTEARQQMVFRQFDGLFPMPEWFQVGIPQSWAWTLLAPFISYCPANQTRLVWQNFPALRILNQPNPARKNGSAGFNETLEAGASTLNETAIPDDDKCFDDHDDSNDCPPAITQNRTIPLSWPGRVVNLTWESPGRPVGPNNSYITSSAAGEPAFVAWVTQLNVTYSRLTVLNSSHDSEDEGDRFTWSGSTVQPNVETFMGDPAVNGTIFIAITDTNLSVTPYNISLINPHVVAGPALYQAG